MLPSNKIVHGMWIGKQLSRIELLTMESFHRQGHEFHLWAYDEIETPLPAHVLLHDATEIIPRHRVFSYRRQHKWGQGKGSYAGFSDIFRYKLLHEKGGWWADMDVACLRPLDFAEEYVFRNHDQLAMVGNLMKCPKGSPLMLDCYKRAIAEVDSENTDWFKPIRILNEMVEKHDLTAYIRQDIANVDQWDYVKKYVYDNPPLTGKYYAIHWMNEVWRSRGLDKNHSKPCTTLGKMMYNHGISKRRCTRAMVWGMKMRYQLHRLWSLVSYVLRDVRENW